MQHRIWWNNRISRGTWTHHHGTLELAEEPECIVVSDGTLGVAQDPEHIIVSGGKLGSVEEPEHHGKLGLAKEIWMKHCIRWNTRMSWWTWTHHCIRWNTRISRRTWTHHCIRCKSKSRKRFWTHHCIRWNTIISRGTWTHHHIWDSGHRTMSSTTCCHDNVLVHICPHMCQHSCKSTAGQIYMKQMCEFIKNNLRKECKTGDRLSETQMYNNVPTVI